jgi:hypothetical protein
LLQNTRPHLSRTSTRETKKLIVWHNNEGVSLRTNPFPLYTTRGEEKPQIH